MPCPICRKSSATYPARLFRPDEHAADTDHDRLFQEQWRDLRDWFESGGVLDSPQRPSVLDGWTVGDLVAHTGRSFLAVVATTDDPGQEPQSLLTYVSHYPSAATEIADGTRDLAAQISDNLLAGVDECAARGFGALALLHGPVVRGPRGSIRRSDFVATRLIELVVHGDDLSRSVPMAEPVPLLGDAVELVAQRLRDAYVERTGRAPTHETGLGWIRLAAGRVASDDPSLPLL